MPERRASRFALEVLFLVALAVGLTLANQDPLVIAAIMAVGWLIVALVEWAAWRGEPHYGAGLPPRYYVPQVALPPRRPLEQVGAGYPSSDQGDDAPTWIASPALRAEVLGEWPVAAPALAPDDEVDETTVEPEDTVDAPGPEPEPVAEEPEPVAEEPEPDAEPEPEVDPVAAVEPAAKRRRLWGRRGDDDDADPWVVEELPVAPDDPDAIAAGNGHVRTALHRIDPLAQPEPKRRRWRREQPAEGPVAQVPARPDGVRALPGRSRRQD